MDVPGVGGATGLAAATLLDVPGTPPMAAPGAVISSERCMVRVALTAGSYLSWLSSLLPVSYSTLTDARMRSVPTTGARVAISRRVISCSIPSLPSDDAELDPSVLLESASMITTSPGFSSSTAPATSREISEISARDRLPLLSRRVTEAFALRSRSMNTESVAMTRWTLALLTLPMV